MTIEIPEKLEVALKTNANVQGVSPDVYVRGLLERELVILDGGAKDLPPYKSMRGMWAKYGISLPEEEIDANRKDMLRGSIFAEDAE